jgi:SAM-dependent methyltransferase
MLARESVDSPYCLAVVTAVLRGLEIQSLLDVGSATGRALRAFAAALPGTLVCGVEPVAALVQQGAVAGVTESISLLQASGDALPFADAGFDAVSEFSVLHHVPEPAAVVAEMLRVARRYRWNLPNCHPRTRRNPSEQLALHVCKHPLLADYKIDSRVFGVVLVMKGPRSHANAAGM